MCVLKNLQNISDCVCVCSCTCRIAQIVCVCSCMCMIVLFLCVQYTCILPKCALSKTQRGRLYLYLVISDLCEGKNKTKQNKTRGSGYESAWICKVKTTVRIHSLQKGSHWKGSNHSQDSCRRNKNQGCKQSAACGDGLVTSVQCLYLG